MNMEGEEDEIPQEDGGSPEEELQNSPGAEGEAQHEYGRKELISFKGS